MLTLSSAAGEAAVLMLLSGVSGDSLSSAGARILRLIHINILGLLTNSSRPLIFGLNRSWKMKHQSWLVQWFETFNIFLATISEIL